jgi:hypothetical protein
MNQIHRQNQSHDACNDVFHRASLQPVAPMHESPGCGKKAKDNQKEQ